MKIVEEREPGLVWVRPSGRLDSNSSPELEQTLLGLFDEGKQDVVVDMSEVPYISSRGLRTFLVAAKRAETSGGRLAVCALQDFTNKVFEVSGFRELLSVFDSSAKAAEFFAGAPRANPNADAR